MPLGEIAGEILGGAARLVGRVLAELVVEILLQGTGHTLIRIFRPKYQPSDVSCGLAGLVFWLALAALGYWLYLQVK